MCEDSLEAHRLEGLWIGHEVFLKAVGGAVGLIVLVEAFEKWKGLGEGEAEEALHCSEGGELS